MISRTKLKSVSDAAGKPTSISLKPSFSSMSNRRRFFSAPIGSIRAWLPSRRSTLHQAGAWSRVRDGQVRSGRLIAGKARYLWIGIVVGMGKLLSEGRRRRQAGGLKTPAGAKSPRRPRRKTGRVAMRKSERNHESTRREGVPERERR